MKCPDFDNLSDAYLDGTLPPAQQRSVEAHLQSCARCRLTLAESRALRSAVTQLPREVYPVRDLWPEIQARLVPANDATTEPQASKRQRRRSRWIHLWLPAAAALTLAALNFWPQPQPPSSWWQVDTLSGTPRIGHTQRLGLSQLHVGDWLETDESSRAKLSIGTIGEVSLEPNSRLRLLTASPTDHRVELAQGTMHAFIWAPPRLFFVETPSATAIDLGCAYTLTVDDHGGGILEVAAGYVALAHGTNETIIPAGMSCLTRIGSGPGTPFANGSAAALRPALERFDFNGGGADALAIVLAEAKAGDQVTLWHLLSRVPTGKRGEVFDKLAAFQAPPEGVTREGILAGNATMRTRWASDLGLMPIYPGNSEP